MATITLAYRVPLTQTKSLGAQKTALGAIPLGTADGTIDFFDLTVSSDTVATDGPSHLRRTIVYVQGAKFIADYPQLADKIGATVRLWSGVLSANLGIPVESLTPTVA